MSLTKDGFYKSFSGAIGNNSYLLEAGGGHIAWGNSSNQIPYSNGTVNSNLNADMTDGLHVHTGRNSEANKIVRTDGSGYIQAGYINTSVGTEDGVAWSRVFFEYNNDGYIRKATIPRARAVLVGSSSQVGSPSVPIYWTGSAFNTCIVSFGNSSYGEHNANNINDNGIKYYTSNGPSGIGNTTSDGALYSQAYSTSWVGQIAQDYRNGGLYVRGKNNGTWQSWYTVADSRNWKAKYGTTGSTTYIKININSTTSWMLSFVVRVYQSYTHYDIVFQGYNYGTNHWYSPTATLRSSTATEITVYFGYDSDNHLWVGIPGGNYTGVEIIECCNGYNQTNLLPGDLFTISNVSSLGGTTQTTQTIYRPWYRNETVSNTTNAANATNIYVNQSTGSNTDYPLIWSNQNNNQTKLANQLYKSYNELIYNGYERSIRISNGYNYHPIIKDGAGRPGISISGNYPYIWLTGGGTSNSSHGATITLAAPDATASTNGAIKAWTFGVPGQGATWMDLGYGTSTNPHAHGINNYSVQRLLRFNSSPYQLIISGSGNDTNASLIVNSSRASTWVYGASFFAPNMTTGHNVWINIGKANSTRNSFGLSWHHAGGDGSTGNYGAIEIWGLGNQQRWYADGNTMMYARFQVRNTSNSSYNYDTSAMWIREYNYGGAQSDSWGNAPRLGWHWSGRVAAQIGLASNGWLYEAPNTGTSFYRIVLERSDMKWGINVDLLDGYHAGNSSGQIPISNGTVNTNLNADLLDGMNSTEFVPKRHTNRFYPFVNSSAGQPWYKITLPWAGYTSGSNAGMMTTMEVVLGGSYDNGNNGRIYLQYYFSKNSSNVWSVGSVKGTTIGYRIIENEVTIKYDIANPGIFYIKANRNIYNSIGLENITASDTAPSFDFRNTTIEAIAESSVPSAANQTVPLYHTITTQNGYWANIPIQTGSDTSKYPQFGSLSVINDSQNNSTDGLVYFRHYSNNDWALIVDKSQSYTYGVDIRAGGAYALKVGNGNTRLIGATIIGADASPSYTLDVRGTTRSTGRIYANEWIEFSGSATGLYWPSANNAAHFHPNDATTYGQFVLRGSRGGYSGIQFARDTNYMTIMDNSQDKGLYNQSNSVWIYYYRRDANRVGIRTSSDFGANININGTTHIRYGTLDNTAFKNILTIYGNNSNESSSESFTESNASWGIGFQRQWSSGTATGICAGIFCVPSGSWRAGLAFRVKNNTTASGGAHDVTAVFISPKGALLQQCYNSWLSPARVQIGRLDTTTYSDRSCIGSTDGNLHIDPYSGHSLYLNYYCHATTYFNGSSYYINASGQSNMSMAHLLINNATWWSNWYWTSQSGQPTYIWGSNNGTNMYIWNPSNFSVNRANFSETSNYANEAGYADYATWAVNAGNADTVDGYHASGLFTTFGNSGNNITATIGGTSKTFTVNYANYSGWSNWSHYLAPHYDGGDRPNPQQYFNYSIGVKVAMTRNTTLGGTSMWADTLWINGYTGSDVPYMNALTFARNNTPRFWIHTQSNRATSYGTYYEVYTSYNNGWVYDSNFRYDPHNKRIVCLTANSSWNKHIYTTQSYIGNCSFSFKPANKTGIYMIGLNTDPTKDQSYTSIDYCFYLHSNGNVYIYESNSNPMSYSGYNAGDEFKIEYADGYVRYYHNGVIKRTVTRSGSGAFYVDSSFYTTSEIYDVEFKSIPQAINHIYGTDNTAANAMLHSGPSRGDNAAGSTWIFADDLDLGRWGIFHNQPDNNIEFYGAGVVQAYVGMNNGGVYSKYGFHHMSANDNSYVLLAGGSYKQWTTSATANAIVARDGSGYIYATYYNSNIGDENNISIGSVYVRNTSDNWIRRMAFSTFGNKLRDSGSLDGRYLKLSGGTMNSGAQIVVGSISNSSGAVYNGGIQLRERTYSTTSLDGTVYTDGPAITFHWSGRWVHILNMHSNDLFWDNNKVWHAANDGSDSGLDADLLDGIHASSFYRQFLTSNINFNPGGGLYQGYGTGMTTQGGPTSSWWHIFSSGWSDNASWISQLAIPTTDTWSNATWSGLWYRQIHSSTAQPWRRVLDSNNYTSYLGYIGTTPVQANSVAQAITGITAFTFNGASSAGTNYITGVAGRIFFGGNFHIDSLGSNKTYINHYTTNDVYLVTGGGKVGVGTTSVSEKLTINGWVGTIGNTGWYSITHSGGIYMTESTYVRVYNSKAFLVANSTYYAINNAGGFYGKLYSLNTERYILKPWGADYRTTSDTHTGAICITLPASISNTMVSLWIDVYNYSSHTSFSVHVGGYTYNNSTWVNSPSAMVYGANHTVRLGHNGTSFVIYIGETNSRWRYPQVSVRDVVIGYSPSFSNWANQWSVSFVTSFSNVTATITHYAWTSRNQTGLFTAFGNSGNNITATIGGINRTFTVNYAAQANFSETSNYADEAGYADYATWAVNADTVDGQHFTYSNSSNSPTYLWGTNSSGSNFLAARGSMTVGWSNYTNNVYVSQHTANNVDYPLVWSNQNNTNSAWGQQLHKSHSELIYNPANKRIVTQRFQSSLSTGTHIAGLNGSGVPFNSTAAAGYNMVLRVLGTGGAYNIGAYNNSFVVLYGAQSLINAGTNSYTHSIQLMNLNGLTMLKNLVVDGNNHVNEATSASYRLKVVGSSYFDGYVGIGTAPASSGIGRLVFPENEVAINFRQNNSAYYSKIEYMTNGNEALVFANTNSVTSFIFKCGYNLSNSSDWNTRFNTTTNVPTVQIKNQSLYINEFIADGATPSYNLYVNNSTYSYWLNNIHFNYVYLNNSTSWATNFDTNVFGDTDTNYGKFAIVRGHENVPAEFSAAWSSGIAWKGADTKGMVSVKHDSPLIKFAGGNSTSLLWWLGITGTTGTTYNLNFETLSYSGSTLTVKVNGQTKTCTINSGSSINHTKTTNTSIKQYILGAGNNTQPSNGTLSQVYTSSNFYFTHSGAYHASDARKKYDIRDILNEDVNKLFETENGFIRHFKWKQSNEDAYGFIAQELQEYCPEAVDFNNDDGFYAVNYNVAFSKIIGAMFKKIKELENKLKENGIS